MKKNQHSNDSKWPVKCMDHVPVRKAWNHRSGFGICPSQVLDPPWCWWFAWRFHSGLLLLIKIDDPSVHSVISMAQKAIKTNKSATSTFWHFGSHTTGFSNMLKSVVLHSGIGTTGRPREDFFQGPMSRTRWGTSDPQDYLEGLEKSIQVGKISSKLSIISQHQIQIFMRICCMRTLRRTLHGAFTPGVSTCQYTWAVKRHSSTVQNSQMCTVWMST